MTALTAQPAATHPAQLGDLLVVWHPDPVEPWSETYEVREDSGPYSCGDLVLCVHTHDFPSDNPERDASGTWEGRTPDKPWRQVRSERLTFVRGGAIVHDGPGTGRLPAYLASHGTRSVTWPTS
ncbi:hypothetical protein SMD44_p10083 (plasmid) [Streptomyces alboflavus]|uniref:Uncharacterized protein n=1 Tax=Streptomyces alboflavus TaxID=67267 RepID=A0A291W4V9_9ACTN|nr:hypothetical protein [Streptomyces alboflavus]ATM24582.1 hypothetical protein SMD44_p10083 [Streptomyces alboflavus]